MLTGKRQASLAIFVKHGRPLLLFNVNQGQVVIKRELDDLGTDLKSGLYIAVYYDVKEWGRRRWGFFSWS